MKEKIRAAMARLQQSGKTTGKASFTFNNPTRQKSVKAEVYFNTNTEFEVEVLETDGYNLHYIRSRTKYILKELSSEVLPYPKSGDDVWTKEHLSGLTTGQTVTLNSGDYYYAVNSGLLDCGGRQLGQSYQARFRKYQNASCSPGGIVMKFSIFQL